MPTLTRIALSLLVPAATVACATPITGSVPAHCIDLQGDRVDGLYTLYAGGDPNQPWLAYCAGDVEYLPLAPVADINFSEVSDGASTVRTTYSMVRIDPDTLAVDVGDRRFAKSTGTAVIAGGLVDAVPYGVAVGTARANIDLRGASFRVLTPFTVRGDAKVAPSADAKVVELAGRARDSATAPLGADLGVEHRATGYLLQLEYIPCVTVEGVCEDAEVHADAVGE